MKYILLNSLYSLNYEIVEMSTSSTVRISLILIGRSSQRVVVFMIELLKEQALSLALTNPDVITGLVYEHTTVEPMVVQNLDEKNIFVVFTEGEDIEKLCNAL